MITNPGAAGAVVVAAHVTRSAAYKKQQEAFVAEQEPVRPADSRENWTHRIFGWSIPALLLGLTFSSYMAFRLPDPPPPITPALHAVASETTTHTGESVIVGCDGDDSGSSASTNCTVFTNNIFHDNSGSGLLVSGSFLTGLEQRCDAYGPEDRFVTPWGKDENDCSCVSPCRTVARGIETLGEGQGQTLHMVGGEY